MTTTTDTDTLLTLEVPAPWTKLQVGEGTVAPGVSIETDEHVRMYAWGSTAASDLVAQATGQLWLQAIDDVVAMAKGKAILSSGGSTQVTANDGITVLAGFKPSAILSDEWPGTFPEGVEGYSTSADVVGAVWTGFTVALGVATAAIKLTEACVGTSFSWTQSTSAAINLVGAGLNLGSLGWSRDLSMPGIQLWSEGGTLIGSTFGSVSLLGAGGVIMAAPFTSAFALYKSEIAAPLRVGMSSCGSVAISAILGGTIRSFLGTTLSARTGAMKVTGMKQVNVGTPNRPGKPWPAVITMFGVTSVNPQQITQMVTFSALKKVSVDSPGGVTLDCMGVGGIEALATSVEIAGILETKLTAGPWKIALTSPGDAKLASVAKPGLTQIVVSPTGVKITGDPTSSIALGPTSIDIASGASSVSVIPGVSVAVNGTVFAIE